MALYAGTSGDPAVAQDAVSYHKTIGEPEFPVVATGNGELTGVSPMTGRSHPEVCAVAPDMSVLSCYSGHNTYQTALEDIRVHAGL